MKYIQTLLERNKANKEQKNAVMPTRREDPDEAGEHSSPTKATGGTQRNQKKVRGERPPREGEAPNTRGHEGRAPMRNIPKKSAMTRPRMAGPQGKLPDSKRESTVYHQMGMLMAEALGLVSERNNFMAARDTSTIQDKAKKTGESPADLRAAGGSSTLASIAREGRERRARAAAEKAKKSTEDK